MFNDDHKVECKQFKLIEIINIPYHFKLTVSPTKQNNLQKNGRKKDKIRLGNWKPVTPEIIHKWYFWLNVVFINGLSLVKIRQLFFSMSFFSDYENKNYRRIIYLNNFFNAGHEIEILVTTGITSENIRTFDHIFEHVIHVAPH